MPALDTVAWLDPNGGTVTLHLTVGHGQPGATRVEVDGALVAESDEDDPATLSGLVVDLGPPNEVSGKNVVTTTVIEDVNPASDQTSVTWRIDEASPPLNESRSENVTPGERVVYSGRIRLAL